MSNLHPKFDPETHSEQSEVLSDVQANDVQSNKQPNKQQAMADVELKATVHESEEELKEIPVPDYVPDGYSIKHYLGSGQTADVYLAKHHQFGQVALKLIRPEIKGNYVHTRMFTNEVYLTTRLRHPFVINAYEGDPLEQKAFLALEYCAGGTLDSFLVRNEQFDLQETYKIILQIAAALSFSHTRGVLHRDVKPANILLKANGDARLADFGTGVYMDKIPKDEKVGTVYYMSPELFKGKLASIQSDIYSLGVLAYELVTAQRPFRGKTYNQVMQAHLSKIPPNPKHIRKDLDKSVATAIMKAISGTPEKRYETVAQFKEAIEKAVKVDISQKKEAPMLVGRKSRLTDSTTTTGGEGQKLKVTIPEVKPTKDKEQEVQTGFIRRFFVKKKKK